MLGAYITDYVGWEGIFYINFPVGLISLGLMIGFYKENITKKQQWIQWSLPCCLFPLSSVCLFRNNDTATYDFTSIF